MRAAVLALIALAFAACATPDPGVRASLPHPATGAGAAREDIDLGDGIYAQRWRPVQSVRGVLVIVHGLKDHSDRYSDFIGHLTDAGFAVYALDLRGHGRSAGARVTIDRFDDYVADVARLVDRARDDEAMVPIFVFGHSMGGAIVATYVETRRPAIAGVILSAPAIGLDAPALEAGLIAGLGGLPLIGRLPMFEPKTDDFSSRPEIADDMRRDPLVWNHGAPVHTAGELVGAIGRVWDRAGDLTTPILILHGTADRLTAPAASRDFLARVGSPDHTLRLYDGAWHDLVHEPMREQIARDVLAWMTARLGGPATPEPLPTMRLTGDHAGTVGRVALRGAYLTSPSGGDGDLSAAFGLGRTPAIGIDLEGRVGSGRAGWGLVTVGARLGTHGYVTLGAGGGYALGGGALAAQLDLQIAGHIAGHLRETGLRVAGASTLESELDLRLPTDRTFWGRGRRGNGFTLGARVDGAFHALAILAGIEVLGFD